MEALGVKAMVVGRSQISQTLKRSGSDLFWVHWGALEDPPGK